LFPVVLRLMRHALCVSAALRVLFGLTRESLLRSISFNACRYGVPLLRRTLLELSERAKLSDDGQKLLMM
jgi:hypothetical protein